MKRTTQQRRVILEVLSAHRDHPTAEELYRELKSRLPSISLGTVYRNLDLLSSNGLVNRISGGSGPSRYDPVHDGHPHVRCPECNRVFDLPEDCSVESLLDMSSLENHGLNIEGILLEFSALCKDCAADSD